MGHWGTAITASDTFMEVYETYFHLYNHDLPVEEIKEKLKAHFAEIINNEQTANDFWFALAKALWECRELDEDTFNRVKKIINEKQDLRIWKELEAKEKDLKAREKVLDKFLATISVEKEKPKARKKIVYYTGIYPKGICLAVKLPNGNYGGLLVLDQEKDTLGGENLLAANDLNMSGIPAVTDFQKANMLTGIMEGPLGQPLEVFYIFVMEAKRKRNNKAAEQTFINVGQLPIERVFEKYFETPYRYKDDWNDIAKVMEEALNNLAKGQRTEKSATLMSWLR